MKCPHCGVHYLDTERQCPVCGRRPGVFAPKKKPRFSSPDTSGEPFPRVSRTGEPAAPRPDAPPSAPRRTKQSGCAPGCLIVAVVLFVLTLLPTLLGFGLYRDVMESSAQPEQEELFYEPLAPTDVLPAGTWQSEDGALLLTLHADGAVAWTDGVSTAEDAYPVFDRLLLTDGLAPEYCSEAELSRFPIDTYTHYHFYFYDPESELGEYDLYLYLPTDAAPEDIASVDCYDWERDQFFTLTLTDQPAVLPAPDSQSA